MSVISVTIIIPAAGFSRRMRGRDKLLEPINGVPILRLIAAAARRVSLSVIVVCPASPHPRHAALKGLEVTLVECTNPENGMSESLRTGLGALPKNVDGIMVLPADMPHLNDDALAHVINTFRDDPNVIVRGATVENTPGHPVIFPKRFLPELMKITGDQGARTVLQEHAKTVRLVPLTDNAALVDLDTPEAWARWRVATNTPR